MIINSWELLLKAQIIRDKSYEDIFYTNGKSISITDSLRMTFDSECAIKQNLELIVDLRDQAIHLLIKELQPDLSEIFQANVLNYQNQYKSLLGNSPLAGQSIGMMSLIIDGPSPEIAIIKNNYGKETSDEVSKFLKRVKQLKSEYNSNEFAITIDHQLTLSKSKNKSDIKLTSGDSGEATKIITIPKNVKDTHPYFTESAIQEINKQHGVKVITTYSFQAIIKKHDIHKKLRFFDNQDRKRYSKEFVSWVINNLKHNSWLVSAIENYKIELKNKKPAS